MKYDYLFKIILVGDTNTGKSYFCNLLNKTNTEGIPSTIGVDFTILYKNINNKTIRVNLWDTAGQERFSSIIQSYFRDITGYILFFDVNNQETFYSLKRWMENINENNKCLHEHPLILLGNKNDLSHKVSQDDIIDFTEKYNLIYIETSLRENKINIDEIFDLLLDKIYTSFILNKKEILCTTIKKQDDIKNKTICFTHDYGNGNNKSNNNLLQKKCC